MEYCRKPGGGKYRKRSASALEGQQPAPVIPPPPPQPPVAQPPPPPPAHVPAVHAVDGYIPASAVGGRVIRI